MKDKKRKEQAEKLIGLMDEIAADIKQRGHTPKEFQDMAKEELERIREEKKKF